eukprot:939651-Amorphochlora_amoeboformis.AAC.2
MMSLVPLWAATRVYVSCRYKRIVGKYGTSRNVRKVKWDIQAGSGKNANGRGGSPTLCMCYRNEKR